MFHFIFNIKLKLTIKPKSKKNTVKEIRIEMQSEIFSPPSEGK